MALILRDRGRYVLAFLTKHACTHKHPHTACTPHAMHTPIVPLQATYLREALLRDPGFFPFKACPEGMCEAPSAATATSGALADPIPVWWLVMATGYEHHTAAAKDAIFNVYVSLLAESLVPHLAATPIPRLDWVALKVKKLGTEASYTEDMIQVITSLVGMLSQRTLFDNGLAAVLANRDSRVEAERCPDPNSKIGD